MMVCLLEFHTTILLGGFIDEEPAINPHYTPLRQMRIEKAVGTIWLHPLTSVMQHVVASLKQHSTSLKTIVGTNGPSIP
jgi:hypothetical protein